MYMNTTYKAFVAKAAAGLMQTMVADALANGKINNEESWNENKPVYKFLALQATLAANALADELESNWRGTDGGQTVFFDVQDSLTSKLEEAIGDVTRQLEDLTEETKKLVKNFADE